MIALIQRAARAHLTIEGSEVARIGRGILALIGIEAGDSAASGRELIDKVLNYRIFPDEAGKMNLSLRRIDGGLLLVPQFTLVADTKSGTRAGFSGSPSADEARLLYDKTVEVARTLYPGVASGIFGADMQVELVNDGPVTFWLETRKPA